MSEEIKDRASQVMLGGWVAAAIGFVLIAFKRAVTDGDGWALELAALGLIGLGVLLVAVAAGAWIIAPLGGMPRNDPDAPKG